MKSSRVSRRRSSNLFTRRIVISMPNYGPFIMAFVLYVGIADKAVTFSMIVMTIIAIMSLGCVIVSRYQVKLVRDEVSKIIRGTEDDADELDSDEAAEPAERPAQRIRLAK
jgi:hypothetical protein